MQQDTQLNTIIERICQRQLGGGIMALENFLLAHPLPGDMEKLQAIKDDYRLMTDYWQRGFNDPQRDALFSQLLHRLYMLACNIAIRYRFRNSNYWMALYQRPRKVRIDWSLSAVRQELEDYVANAAMLELEPEHMRQDKTMELNQRHQQLIHDLFDYIVTSRLWSDNLAEAFVGILLSPVVDTIDQQTIVSAITLSALCTFGFNKMNVLMQVYEKTTDEQVRQRALVGWVMVMDEQKASLYPEMREEIVRLCQNPRCCSELTELQMQLFFCMDAESDQRKIRDEIMPDIISGSRMKVTKNGLVEMDEDTLEDILHPDAAERDMEKMEQSVQRMADMQKQGSDIYFAGFSQMKRFTFFSDLSNWFVPFYPAHPAVSNIWQHSKGSKLLRTITMMGAFCDSDKYSFVLAFEHVLKQLPANMLKMIDNGEASPMPIGGEVDEAEQHSPAFMRRMYLQNLYRFFRLYPMRNEFQDPYSRQHDYLFFANPLLADTPLMQRMMEIAAFLMKRNRYEEALAVMNNYPQIRKDYHYYMMMGKLALHLPQASQLPEVDCFRNALELMPGDRKALAGLARALYHSGAYDEAFETYETLLGQQPDSRAYMLNAAICLVNMQRVEEALKYLFKLNYLYPSDEHVNRVLAWSLTLEGKYEQALKLYKELLASEQPVAEDMMNCGYCLWFAGDVPNAIQTFRQFVATEEEARSRIEAGFHGAEYELIRQHQISDIEIQLMLDALL